MGDQVALLLLGFLLTTVARGFLGYVFQQRAWSHQFDVQRRGTEREAAFAALNELSSLLDKRRYRMLLTYWRLDWPDSGELEDAITAYRSVLEEWNDGLNRRPALVATHFEADLKRELDVLYEEYREAGRLLELAIRDRRAREPAAHRTAWAELHQGLNAGNCNVAADGLAAIIAARLAAKWLTSLKPPLSRRRSSSSVPALWAARAMN